MRLRRNTSRQPKDTHKRKRKSSSSDSDNESPQKRRRNDSKRMKHLGDVETSGRKHIINEKDFLEKSAALKTTVKKTQASQLKPMKVDFHISDNRENHHTDEYAMESLIVRRGQEFKVTVTFDRPFDDEQDKLIVQLTYGSRPQESKKSLIRVRETIQLVTSSWGMHIVGSHGNSVDLSIMSPHDALVGEYSVYVETKTKKSGSEDKYLSFRKKLDETFVVLFNAWCIDDVVYMTDEADRQEYVMNDRGRIWVGSKRSFEGMPWYFGQFEEISLPTCLELLDIAELGSAARGNATRVCRVISQMANYKDGDGGILFGRWTKTYPKRYTEPSEWTGSVAILKKFAKRHHVVRYGQCWVFSGLVTTLLRAIGIPTRSVTNFESAHDTDVSMTIDFHVDKEGEPMDDLNVDTIWNFHVWNESYFGRPDLPPNYGGWQAHDATPQETSEGVFRCGPCPTKAIKEGQVYIPYDGKFIFGEVNGDRVYWEVDDDGEMKVYDMDRFSIGKNISTKAVGSNERHDITHEYKFPEGSAEERQAVRQANKYSSRKDENIYSQNTSNDVSFEAIIDDENITIGDDVDIKLHIKNTSKETRTITAAIVTKVAFYTGIVARDLETLREEVVLGGKKEKTLVVTITAKEYSRKVAAGACIKVFYKAKVEQTGQVFNGIDTVELKKPQILCTHADKIRSGKSFDVKFYFTNPLPVKLTNCVFNLESSRHLSPDAVTKALKHAVKPNEEVSVTVRLEAYRRGRRYVDVSFKSDQMTGVRAEFDFQVAK